jgi:hypothetical protein
VNEATGVLQHVMAIAEHELCGAGPHRCGEFAAASVVVVDRSFGVLGQGSVDGDCPRGSGASGGDDLGA